MTASGGEALGVALDLFRAPALRTVLWARPLPDGVGALLSIAAGSKESVRRASQRTGHPEGELLEAARFYVQQVLLAENADAYRVLGAERGASHGILRDHHRLLLRWLHPDRSEGAQWESALSTRVNQAWNQLRNEHARAQYDAALDIEEPRAPQDPVDAAPVPLHMHVIPPEAPRRRQVGPLAVTLLGLACLGLVWLAGRHDGEFDGLAGDVPTRAAATTSAATTTQVLGPAPVAPIRAPAAAMTGAPKATPTATPTAPPTETAMTAAARPALIPPKVQAQAQAQAQAQPQGQAQAQAQVPVPVPLPVPVPTPAAAAAAVPASASASVRAPAPQAAHVAQAAPQQTPAPAAPDSVAPPSPSPSPASHSVAANDRAPAMVASRTSAPEPPAEENADPLQLLREAESMIHAVTAYLATDAKQPAWLDQETALEADAIRGRLQGRHPDVKRRRMDVDSPNWSLDARTAAVLGAYRLRGGRAELETGVLRVELTRKGKEWRVAALNVEPAR